MNALHTITLALVVALEWLAVVVFATIKPRNPFKARRSKFTIP